jgi:uncharacterized protein YukE
MRFGYEPAAATAEVDALQGEANRLKSQLDAINHRIEELKPKQG